MSIEDVRMKKTYFEWLCYIVTKDKHNNSTSVLSFSKLLNRLHSIEFEWSIANDANRASDGISLRDRFGYYYEGPCSILEMMVGLALKCEETIMDNPKYGDRTGQWFWGMIINLGLGGMTDANYDDQTVVDILERFLDREYEPTGKGGLFTVRDKGRDMRDIEIWTQLNWYLDKILGLD